jgi:hypothetical protein
MAMKQFQYTIARYLPDPVRGEFFNIGVVIHDIAAKRVYAKFASNYQKLKHLDPYLNLSSFRMMIDMFGQGLDQPNKELGFLELATSGSLGMITFTPVRGGLTKSIHEEISNLFEYYISIDNKPTSPKPRAIDQHVLSQKVKVDFYQSGNPILQKMQQKSIIPELGIDFDFVSEDDDQPKVVQPVSFDVGDAPYKLRLAKDLAFNAHEVKNRSEYSNAKIIALVQEPVSGKKKGTDIAEAILNTAYRVIKVDSGRSYLDQLVHTLQED